MKIKIGPFVLWVIKGHIERTFKKKRKSFPLDACKTRLDVPFIDDGIDYHKMDILYADESKRKNVCVIDIHGGAYMYCRHRDNFMFGLEFVKEGYDFIAIDYLPNNGKMDTKDLIDDCVKAINYIFDHLKELELEGREFYITGDSAGGHFALLLGEAINSKKVADTLGYTFPDIPLRGVILNCPVYDYEDVSSGGLSKRGMKRMFGPRCLDKEWMKFLSPKTYVNELKIPIFVSTCKKDFLRSEPLKLVKDYENRKDLITFIDLDSDTKGVDHVHNVVRPQKEESKYINSLIVKFIEETKKKR